MKNNKRILAVSSGGGHWIELIRLVDAFEGHHVAYASTDSGYGKDVAPAALYTLREVSRWNKLLWVLTFGKLLWVMLREKPDIVISTGALPGYFSLRIAKWFGARTIWIDSLANVDELSMSGRLIAKYADLWLTQWPHLAKPNGPLFYGSVL